MLDLTKEEKIVLVFILASLLIGSAVGYYKKRPESLLLAEPTIAGQPAKPININTADINGLIKIKGVGVKTAEKIVEYRQVNGPFFSKEDIMKIKGMGPSKFETLKDRISVE
jgi:competence ComEA-like helix-hairpin-helix protein